MKKLLIITIILAGVSTTTMASPKEGRKGKLSFVPKISFGKDTGSDSVTDGDIAFHGLDADLLYGVTRNFEVGVNASWSPYGIDLDKQDKQSFKTYDDTLDTFGLMGVMRYSVNQLDILTPYISARGGWVFGDAEFETTSETGKVEGKWAAGVAIGLEFKNVNLELGYEITEFKTSVKSEFYEGTFQEELVYMSLGYRFD
jgi:opacity protein-like surface antigen